MSAGHPEVGDHFTYNYRGCDRPYTEPAVTRVVTAVGQRKFLALSSRESGSHESEWPINTWGVTTHWVDPNPPGRVADQWGVINNKTGHLVTYITEGLARSKVAKDTEYTLARIIGGRVYVEDQPIGKPPSSGWRLAEVMP